MITDHEILPLAFLAGIVFCLVILATSGAIRSRDEYWLTRLAAGKPTPKDWNPKVGVGVLIAHRDGMSVIETDDGGWILYQQGAAEFVACFRIENLMVGPYRIDMRKFRNRRWRKRMPALTCNVCRKERSGPRCSQCGQPSCPRCGIELGPDKLPICIGGGKCHFSLKVKLGQTTPANVLQKQTR